MKLMDLPWWQKAVFYQIYPRSFADGNGDGIGDFQGILAKLDYLKHLGIDAIWLSPHYPSPLFDCGYDVADYCSVAPEYGTLELFEQFLEEAHRRDLRVILDLVLNHTSDQHPWFLESRSSRDHPRRDWYIWRDGKNGGPPNNWYSTFGGSAWEYDPATDQYYYHFFFKQQPDLNWRNPEVKAAMWDAVRFWLKMGVDGFRLDAVGTIFEVEDLRGQKAPVSHDELLVMSYKAKTREEQAQTERLWHSMFKYQVDLPEVHDLMKELRRVVDEFPGRVLVGETEDIRFYGNGRDELHLNFNFPLMETRRITPAWVRRNQRRRLSRLPDGAWPCNTLGNHDSPRMLSRFGDGEHDREIARVNLALILTLKGTPFLYNGEEIGMSDYLFTDVSKFRDQLGIFYYNLLKSHPDLVDPEEAALIAARGGRDKCRTPLQWENTVNAGFSPEGVEPWLPVNPDYAQGVNVADQEADQGSLLNFYRTMLRIRRENPALMAGEYEPLGTDAACLSFLRIAEEQTLLVVLNMSEKKRRLNLKVPGQMELVFSSHRSQGTEMVFEPFEVFLAELRGVPENQA
ncbi:glycosidase [Anaerolinea thermolimosa]|nr:glycosidase [Anaerolinea thermolimosa]